MSIRIDERQHPPRVVVEDGFKPEDVARIEDLALRQTSRPAVLVDFRATRNKPLATLWILAQLAASDPERYLIEGLTAVDLRLLQILGIRSAGGPFH